MLKEGKRLNKNTPPEAKKGRQQEVETLKKNKAEGEIIGTNFEQNTVTIKLDANCKAQDWQSAHVKKVKVNLSPA